MPTGKKKETKDIRTKKVKETLQAVVSNEDSIMTRLEVVEKMLVITREDINEMKTIFERIRSRLGI